MASAGVHAIAGAAGGMLAMTLLYPLDNIRARLQVQEIKKKAAPVSGAAAVADRSIDGKEPSDKPASSHPDEHVYTGSWDCFVHVVTKLGWQNLYRGLKSAIVGMGVSSAVYFYWYQIFRNLLLARSGKQSIGPLANVGVAALAGVVNVFLTTPFWVVNTRMTIQKAGKPEFNGLWDAFVKIAAENKFYGFYRGIVPSLILVSNPAIQFVTYEQITRILLRRRAAAGGSTSLTLNAREQFIIGAIAKALATVATYPYQVVKSRLQAEKGTHGAAGAPHGLTNAGGGTWAKVRRMWNTEGWEAFYAGMGAKLSQTVLTAALMFVLYEKLLVLIQRAIGAVAPAAVTAVAVAVSK